MKKITLFAITLAIIGLASCGNAVKNANGSDSTVIENRDTLQTADLSMFFLQGPVKTVSYQRREDGGAWEETDKLEFDKEGRLTGFQCWTASGDGYLKILYAKDPDGEILVEKQKRKIERDESGRITMLPTEYTDGKNNSNFGLYWTYNIKGRPSVKETVVMGYYMTEEFTSWNEKLGLPIVMKYEMSGRGMEEETTHTYTYKKFDQWGNFTEREISTHGKFEDRMLLAGDDGEEHYADDSYEIRTNSIEHRIITYYE